MKRIAIIGAGFSGACLASLLAPRRSVRSIFLIEKSARFGPGLAYGEAAGEHLLNVRAAGMSGYPDRTDDFAAWLGARAEPSTFATRAAYGRYVEAMLSRANRMFGPIRRIRGEAIACQHHGDAWRVRLASGRLIEADAVVLATGHRDPAPIPVMERAGVRVLSPWDESALARMPSGDVLLLGTGLTMIDVALRLSARRGAGAIWAMSRRGLIPREHLEPPLPAPTAAFNAPPALSDAVRALRLEVRAMAERGEPWQLAIDRLRPQTSALWRRLPLEAQRRFLRHLRPWWDVHRHRMAPEVAARLRALTASSRLGVIAGELVAAELRDCRVQLSYRPRGSHARHTLTVAGVVNCTGGAVDIAAASDRLFNQLLGEGHVRGHANGVGVDVDETGRVRDRSGAPCASMFALGPLTQGAFWESTAVPDVRQYAARLAETLIT